MLPNEPQKLLRVFTADGGKILQKLFQGKPILEVVQESLHRHPGAPKYQRPPEYFRRRSDGTVIKSQHNLKMNESMRGSSR